MKHKYCNWTELAAVVRITIPTMLVMMKTVMMLMMIMMILCRENIKSCRNMVAMISITTGFGSWNRNKPHLVTQVYSQTKNLSSSVKWCCDTTFIDCLSSQLYFSSVLCVMYVYFSHRLQYGLYNVCETRWWQHLWS